MTDGFEVATFTEHKFLPDMRWKRYPPYAEARRQMAADYRAKISEGLRRRWARARQEGGRV